MGRLRSQGLQHLEAYIGGNVLDIHSLVSVGSPLVAIDENDIQGGGGGSVLIAVAYLAWRYKP